ncbi:MAG: S-layer homology domain-containing protein [Candidatus Peribacteraceae bacterium]
MRFHHFLTFSLLLPVVASAVTIAPADFFHDVEPMMPEAVGINLLYNEGIVQGVGDGKFAPNREVNRAEFLKMAILATPSDMRPSVTPRSCFPDVLAAEWFSGTVCGAKDAGIVRGNANPNVPEEQWLFAPATTVTYDAGLKMLSILFGYEIRDEREGESWGQRYYDAARTRGTDLPAPTAFDEPLTRGSAARLIAGFLAESEDALIAFREAEQGNYPPVSSSSSSEVSSSESSSSSVSSSSSADQILYTFPIRSRFLLVGQPSAPIAGGIISPFSEETQLVAVQVKVFQETRSLQSMELVTANGTVLATLLRRTTTDISDYKLTYEAFLTGDQILTLAKATELPVFLRAQVRSKANNGFSEELIHVRQLSVTFRGTETAQTYNVPFTGPFPKHQSTLGRVHNIVRVSPETAPLASGNGTVVSTFTLQSESVDSQAISLSQIVFAYESVGVKAQFGNWQLMRTDNGASVACTSNPSTKTISCPNLSSVFGANAATTTITLSADVTVEPGATGEWFQVSLPDAGNPETLGSVWWTDAVGTFRWLDGTAPLLSGTRLLAE